MENQIELNGEFDDLLDGGDVTETNDDGAPDNSVELPDNLDDNVEDSKDILATILYLATKKYLNLDIENEIINIEITSKSNENL